MRHNLDHIALEAPTIAAGFEELHNRLFVDNPSFRTEFADGSQQVLLPLAFGCSVYIEAADNERHLNSTFIRPIRWAVETDDLEGVIAQTGLASTSTALEPTNSSVSVYTQFVGDDRFAPGLLPMFRETSSTLPSDGTTAHQSLGNCTLERIILRHPLPGLLANQLARMNVDKLVDVELGPAALAFEFLTEAGLVIID